LVNLPYCWTSIHALATIGRHAIDEVLMEHEREGNHAHKLEHVLDLPSAARPVIRKPLQIPQMDPG
jgi:hypothetical protein